MDPNVKIRPETGADFETIFDLTQKAFKTQPRAAGTEGFIIDRLRKKGNLSLSLVAEKRGEILGQVSYSPVEISGQSPGWYGLGPVSVRPDLHGNGVGSTLIRAGLEKLAGLGAAGCVLVGDPGYYHRFGFASIPGLEVKGVPPEAVLALSFSGDIPSGQVCFDPAFFE